MHGHQVITATGHRQNAISDEAKHQRPMLGKTQQPAAGKIMNKAPAVPPVALLTASPCWPAAASGAGSGGMPLAIWKSVVKYTAQIRLSAAKPARFALELMPSVWLTPVGTT